MSASVSESWARIRAWMLANAPEEWDLIQAPATSDELALAAKELGVEFPLDFIEFYGLMNGTDPNGESCGLFPSVDEWDDMAFGPSSLGQIVREWKMQRELLEGGDFEGNEATSDPSVAQDWWNLGWIPMAGNGGGDFYCLDMAPTESGSKGQVISHSHESGDHKRLADSLAVYLTELADALEDDKFEYDTEWGLRKRD